MGHASRRCGSLCVPSPLQRGRQVLSDGGGEAHPGPAHAISHATNDSMHHDAIESTLKPSMRTEGRAKTEQALRHKKLLERAEWPAGSSSSRRSSGPEQPAAVPWPWPSPWHGPLQPERSYGAAGASTASRGSPGRAADIPHYPNPRATNADPLSRYQQALTADSTATNWSTKSQRRHLHYCYCCAPFPPHFLQRPNKASALHLCSCTLHGVLGETPRPVTRSRHYVHWLG